MKKEIIILKNYLLYFLVFVLICMIGITGVFADTYQINYDTDLYYYDNFGSSISAINTQWNESLQTYVSNNITTVANSYGGAVGFSSPINILKGHTYTFSIYFLERNNIALSLKNKIGLGNGPYNSCNNYATSNFNAETLMSTVTKNTVITYSFKATENASYICMPWTTTSNTTQSYAFTEIIIDDLGASGVSQQDINNSLNNQTNIINNSITSSQNTITNNDNNNRDLIINSQEQTRDAIIQNQNDNNNALIENDNANTDKLIEDNKKTFNDCRDSYNLFDYNSFNIFYQYLSYITLNLKANTTYTMSSNIPVATNGANLFIYNTDGAPNTSLNSVSNGVNRTVTTLSDGKIIIAYRNYNNSINSNTAKTDYWYQLQEGSVATEYEEYEKEICTNVLKEQEKTSKGILGKLGDLLDYFNPLSENWFVKKLVDLLVNGLKALFIPDDMSFINDFMDTLSNKLGFIASIPIRLIQFILDLPNVAFTEVNSLHFPRINIFGYYFWDDMNIDLSVGKSVFQTFKYLTDMTCVILCINTLYKWYHNFSGGGAN